LEEGKETKMRALGLFGAAATAAAVALLIAAAPARATPVLNQVNDFEAGTTQGWTNGPAADPTNVNTGGPAGANDNFLRITSRGGGGSGSRLASYNRSSQWVGNYNTPGVTGVEMDLKNFGTGPLVMRLGLQETAGTRLVSTVPFNLPADGLWHHATFRFGAADLTRMGQTPLTTAFTRINELRIIHSTGVDFMGDALTTSVGVDNVRAIPEPGAACLLALSTGALVLRRRR
jgi:hypothetical protein